jgi:hypothetical protein
VNSVLALHVACSAVALATGPWQLSARLRATSLGRHRWMGRAYVAGVSAGGATGLILATAARGGLPARTGFAALAVLWLTATTLGFVRVLERDLQAHRIWMLRSYALTLAAITLRIYLPVSLVAGVPYDPAYQAIAWLSWVPNLVIVEWVHVPRIVTRELARRRGNRQHQWASPSVHRSAAPSRTE